jgi:hypothetical protein
MGFNISLLFVKIIVLTEVTKLEMNINIIIEIIQHSRFYLKYQ